MIILLKSERYWLLSALLLLLLWGCGSSDILEQRSAEAVFEKAKELFDDEEYLDARNQFDKIKLQFPASQYADDAQYYLAECHYKREEFVLASYHYSILRRVYPNSPFFKESLYKNALCFYELSPNYDRDQEYTLKAINAFSEFQAVYPDDSLSKVSEQYFQELRDKLGQREYSIAELYRKLKSPSSSLIYYEDVIDQYDDTIFYEPSFVGKIEALIEMKKYGEAMSSIELYVTIFKNGLLKEKVRGLRSSIP